MPRKDTVPFLECPIDVLPVSVRIRNCLIHHGRIERVDQLLMLTEMDLLKLKNFGRKSLNELKEFLAFHSCVLGTRSSPPPVRCPHCGEVL